MTRQLLIGLPCRNDLESLKAMIVSLFNSTSFPFELVIVIGEGTNQETLDYLNSEAQENRYLEEGFSTGIQQIRIVNQQTKTSLEAYNYLFDLATQEQKDLLITQTDVVFPRLYKRDWLANFYQIAQFPYIGAVVPINGGGMSGTRYVNGFKWVGAWCTYFPYNTILSIGNFDEGYLIGDGVDIDYSYRIYLAGLHVATTNYWVDHHMMNARSDEGKYTYEQNEEFKKQNGEYFRKKFGLNKGPYYKKEVNELKQEIEKNGN